MATKTKQIWRGKKSLGKDKRQNRQYNYEQARSTRHAGRPVDYYQTLDDRVHKYSLWASLSHFLTWLQVAPEHHWESERSGSEGSFFGRSLFQHRPCRTAEAPSTASEEVENTKVVATVATLATGCLQDFALLGLSKCFLQSEVRCLQSCVSSCSSSASKEFRSWTGWSSKWFEVLPLVVTRDSWQPLLQGLPVWFGPCIVHNHNDQKTCVFKRITAACQSQIACCYGHCTNSAWWETCRSVDRVCVFIDRTMRRLGADCVCAPAEGPET